MEQEQRMAMYSRALGVMGAHYSGRPLVEKESTDERKSAADDSAERDRQEKEGEYKKAAKTEKKMKKQDKELKEASKPDYLDFDKDGDKKEPMKKALKEKGKKAHDKAHEKMDEEVTLTKEMVVEYLVNEGYANNEVSAEILHTHMSDEFLEEIEERMLGE